MDLNLAAVVFMGGFVLAIIAAALVLAFRSAGAMLTISGRPAPEPAGRRDEILLGSETDALGTPSGRVQAVLVQPATLEIQALAVSRGAGLLEDQFVPADAILAADGQTVYLAETWTPAAPEEAAGAVPLRLGATVLGADRKRLGKLQVVCFDRESKVVTALAVAGRRDGNSLRLVPVERLQRAGPNRIVTAVPAADWATLQPYASDRTIRQAVLDQLVGDPVLKPFLPSLGLRSEISRSGCAGTCPNGRRQSGRRSWPRRCRACSTSTSKSSAMTTWPGRSARRLGKTPPRRRLWSRSDHGSGGWKSAVRLPTRRRYAPSRPWPSGCPES